MGNWEIILIGFIVILFFLTLIVGGMLLFIHRISHRKWLLKELTIWKKEELLDPSSIDRIEQKYLPPQKESIPPTKIVVTIGSILLGIGLIIFIASNWKDIGDIAKLLGTFSLSIMALLYGYYLKFVSKKPLPILGEGFLLIASLIWGATIIFLFQSFQVSSANNYLLTLLWGITIFPVAIWLKSDPIYYLSYFLLFLTGVLYGNVVESPVYLFLVVGLIPFLLLSENKKHKWIPVSSLALLLPVFTTFESYGLYYLLLLVILTCWWFWKKEEVYLALASSSVFFFILTSLQKPILEKFFGHWFFLIPFLLLLALTLLKNSIASLYVLLFSFFFGFITQFTYDYHGEDYAVSLIKIILMIGTVYLLVERFIKNKDMKLPFMIWGYLALIIPLFVLSFHELINHTITSKPIQGLLFFGAFKPYFYLAVLSVVVVLGMFAFWITSRPEKEESDIYIAITLGLALVGCFLWELFAYFQVNQATLLITIFQNAILLTTLLLTIFWATKKHVNWLINITLVLFLVFVLLRYFDVSWKLLDRSWFFIGGGFVLLIIGSSMEKVRRKLITEENHEK